jgi:protein tyrosine phosphatase
MRVVAESDTMIGLHQTESEVFRRFEWVVNGPGERPLARASAPNYDDGIGLDNTQSMDDAAVQFLVAHGITNVISMNGIELSDEEKKRLSAHSISYTHLPVVDFQAPTLSQLEQAQHSYTSHSSTLVYCGYGHGRTGTVISALQLYWGQDRTHGDYRTNHAETEGQMDVLDQLRKELGYGK